MIMFCPHSGISYTSKIALDLFYQLAAVKPALSLGHE